MGLKQEFEAAEPVSSSAVGVEPEFRWVREKVRKSREECLTPIAQAIAPRSEIPPESTPVEVDARIARLLDEQLKLLAERKVLLANVRATQERSTACLEAARFGRMLLRKYFEVRDVHDREEEGEALEVELRAWAAKPL